MECNGTMDSILNEVRAGFLPKKSLDNKDKFRRLQNSSMTSEDDNTSSPGFPRKRLGSFSGPPGEEQPQDTYSPGLIFFCFLGFVEKRNLN